MLEGKWKWPTIIVLALLLVAAAFILYSQFFGYKYVAVEQGIEFLSNEAEPASLLQKMALGPAFILVFEGMDESPANAYNLVGLTTFNVVMNGNSKATTIVAQALDEKGRLLYCNTNEGDVRTNEKIPAQSCLDFLGSSKDPLIYFHLLDPKIDKPQVIVSSGRIDFYPKELSDPGMQAYIALSVMYGNTDQIINQSNEFLQKIGVVKTGK